MPRNLKITLAFLAVAVLIGLISLRGLDRRIQRLSESTKTEEQARRELLAPGISTPTDVKVQTKIYWAAGPDKIAPVQVAMALSADPVKRAKQVLSELIENPPTTDQRTIPSDAVLLGLYLLPDGTAIADFTEALATETPSGILSEEMAVDSIRLTLENNLPSLTRLKILIHGQEVDTLAGHIDLTGFFDLNPPASPVPAALAGTAAQRGNKK
ncbi:MAG TPA: GerMN domain-containing protein [Candidatus Acidoferrales bacterium]|jgi:spore germination protein GerM|nr:GerMN domain-containing protein [Candidatus Acidoferrales bacterium]